MTLGLLLGIVSQLYPQTESKAPFSGPPDSPPPSDHTQVLPAWDDNPADTLNPLPVAKIAPAGDSTFGIAPFPEALDSNLLRFPYRSEFLSPKWDSVAQAIAARQAEKNVASSGPSSGSRARPAIAGLPGALNRPVRVLLKKTANATSLTFYGEFGLAKIAGPQAIPQAMVVAGKAKFSPQGRDWLIESAAGTKVIRDCQAVRLSPARMGAYFEIDGIPYRGGVDIQLEPASTQLLVINRLGMEEYLRGVLPYELGRVDEKTVEALNALAVVARTFAMKRMLQASNRPFDLYDDVQDQVYKGMKDEYSLSDGAVRNTRGQVLMFADTLAETFYHSTCGGSTANKQDVWGGSGYPYLVARNDRDAQGRPYCSASPLLHWEQIWSPEELTGIVRANFSQAKAEGDRNFTAIKNLTVTRRAVCGRIMTLKLDTDRGTVLVHGDKVRWALKPLRKDGRILESANFEIGLQGRHFVATGTGFGHGVGLCQFGAMGRARAGQGYPDILSAYFAGTRIVEYR